MAVSNNDTLQQELNELVTQRDGFITRLDNGITKLEQAFAEDNPKADSWFEHWKDLLNQYEQVCDQIEDLRKSPNFTEIEEIIEVPKAS